MRTEERPPNVRGERRTVTVLFADLSNFTQLAERLDPEDVAALIRECFREVIEEIRARDGWLEKHIGDAVLAVFGAPVAHEDDPVRAIRAALAIRDRVTALSDRLADRIGEPLDVHVGVNTGLAVIVPAIEHGDGDDFIVVGDTITTAARLQQNAGPGQILVGERTWSATEWCCEYQRQPPLKLKGKQGRIPAWACLGLRSSDGAGGQAARVARSPLVGRAAERAVLERCVTQLTEGRGGFVLVTGDPGIGKTRLLAEAQAKAEERGLLWLQGRTVSYGEPAAYAPFVEILRAVAEIGGEDDDATAWRKLERCVLELFAGEETNEILPYLAMMLSIELPTKLGASVKYLEGGGAGLQIFRATRRLCERLARRQPVALVFEDWHWADETSAALLEHLLPVSGSAPVLFCCSTRAEQSSVTTLQRRAYELVPHDRIVVLELEPLRPADARKLVTDLAERERLSTGHVDEIVETADGNPFFIEEIVRSLEGGKHRPGHLEIPDTLRGAIIARVDRLPTETADVLRAASVLGRSFSYRLLAEVGSETAVDRALDELVEVDLVREAADEGERQFAFKHAVTQEIVYDNILLAERREMHGHVANVLETVFEDRLDELAGTIAFHYTQAEEWDRAQAFLFRAGDHAGSIAASAEALTYYGRALEAYSHAPGHELDAEERAKLDRKIGEAFFRRGEHDKATEYLERALACLGGYWRTPTGVRLRIARAASVQLWHRLLPLPRYREVSDEPDPWMDELSRILDTLGWIYFFSNPERIVLDSFRQLNVAERRGHRLAMVRASTGLGFAFDAVAMRRTADAYHRRAVELCERLENPRSVGIAYLGLAHHQRYQLAAFDQALENYTRAENECRRAGDIRSRMGAMLMLAEVTGLKGDLDTSLGYGRRMIEVAEDAGDTQVGGWGHHATGRAFYLAGELEQAREHLERGGELSERVPDYQALVVAQGNLGLTLIEQGNVDEALDVLERAHQLAQERRLRSFASTDMLKGLAEGYLTLAERAVAQERERLLRRAKRACRALARQRKLDRAVPPALLRLQGKYRWLRGERAKAEKLWRRSVATAEALGLPLESESTRREAGSYVDDFVGWPTNQHG